MGFKEILAATAMLGMSSTMMNTYSPSGKRGGTTFHKNKKVTHNRKKAKAARRARKNNV